MLQRRSFIMHSFFTQTGDLTYSCILGHIIDNIYSFFHYGNIGLTDHIKRLLTVRIYKLKPKLTAADGIGLSSDLFQLKKVYAEFIGKYLSGFLYYCGDFVVIIFPREHIKINDIYRYRLFEFAVIFTAFQLR